MGFNIKKLSCNSANPTCLARINLLYPNILTQSYAWLSCPKGETEALNSLQSNRGDTEENKPGRWCLIIDLSSPDGASVNDRVDKALGSLSYTSVDVIAAKVGLDAMLAKMDIKEANRIIPIS